MKKLIPLLVGGALLIPGGASGVSAADYSTDVAMRAPSKATPGEKIRVVVRPRTAGDSEVICTGDLVLVIKDEVKNVVKTAGKPVRDRVSFAFKLRDPGTHRLVAKYRRGEEDPCGESRERRALRVVKRKA